MTALGEKNVELIAQTVENAIRSERERCARIADEVAAESEMELEGVANYRPDNTAGLMSKGNAMATAQIIASRIRNQNP